MTESISWMKELGAGWVVKMGVEKHERQIQIFRKWSLNTKRVWSITERDTEDDIGYVWSAQMMVLTDRLIRRLQCTFQSTVDYSSLSRSGEKVDLCLLCNCITVIRNRGNRNKFRFKAFTLSTKISFTNAFCRYRDFLYRQFRFKLKYYDKKT